jgi:hypothetical protein
VTEHLRSGFRRGKVRHGVDIDRFSMVRALGPAARERLQLGLGLLLASAGLALARPVAAQNAAQAEALFQRGLTEMQAGDHAAGCPKLAESYRLDPLPGALFTLAECEAAWSKLATAIEHYQSFVDGLTALPPARRHRFDERRRLALEKIAALSATAPEVTLEVAPGAPAGLVVRRDGEPIDPSSYGVARKVDPGQYLFTAELDGRQQWERSVVLALSDRAQVQVPWPLAEPPAPSAATQSEAGSSAAPRSPLRPWFYASGAVGVAGLVAGAVAGGIALGKKKVIDEHCPDRQCDAQGHDAVEAGQSAALASTAGFAVGLAGAAAATTLFLLERRADEREPVAPRRGLRPALVQVRAGVGLGLEGSLR